MSYPQAQDRAALRDLTANLNDRHRNAQFAGRASAELHTLIFFSKQAIAADARIVKVVLRAVMSPWCWQHDGMHSMASSSDWMLASAARVCSGNCLLQASCVLAFKVLQNCCWLLANHGQQRCEV